MGNYDFRAHVSGDTFGGKTITINRPGLTLESVEMELKRENNAKPRGILSTDNGKITITNAANRVFEINEQVLSMPVGTYLYKIKCTYTDGTIKTDLSGKWKFVYYNDNVASVEDDGSVTVEVIEDDETVMVTVADTIAGKSAYEIWLELGNTGSEQDFIDSLKGETKPYKIYVALLTQERDNAPTATILENNIGNIIWTRHDTGDYFGTLEGAFPIEKTMVSPHGMEYLCNGLIDGNQNDKEAYKILPSGSDIIRVQTYRDENPYDEILYYTPVEVRVYE